MQKVPSRSRNLAGRKTDKTYGRNRKYLCPDEVDQLIKATTTKRDALMISLAYHHVLRVTELVELEWEDFDLKAGTTAITARKAV
jgi:integrase